MHVDGIGGGDGGGNGGGEGVGGRIFKCKILLFELNICPTYHAWG